MNPAEKGSPTPPVVIKFSEAPKFIETAENIGTAASLFRVEGESQVPDTELCIIPIDLAVNKSASIKFSADTGGELKHKGKGVNYHSLNIQRKSDTDIPPGSIATASSLGFETNNDALIGVINGRRVVFFHPKIVLASEETTTITRPDGQLINVPLFAAAMNHSAGFPQLAIVTRFPSQRIAVKETSMLFYPAGGVSPDENIITKPLSKEIDEQKPPTSERTPIPSWHHEYQAWERKVTIYFAKIIGAPNNPTEWHRITSTFSTWMETIDKIKYPSTFRSAKIALEIMENLILYHKLNRNVTPELVGGLTEIWEANPSEQNFSILRAAQLILDAAKQKTKSK